MTLRFGEVPSGAEPFVVAGMFTPSHGRLAKRLASSLRTQRLPHLIFEVPTVHRSISPRGTMDLTYAKPNFIWHVMGIAKRPVLYLDVDCVVQSPPKLIFSLANEGCDFSILNWLALEDNDAYRRWIGKRELMPNGISQHVYMFSHRISWESKDQLICSGAAQFWNNSDSARRLLAAWFETIKSQELVADDQCLDFAFNNNINGSRDNLNAGWLPKSYARYAWWIFDKPVIDHPEFPNSSADWKQIADPKGRERFRASACNARANAPVLPENQLLDARSGRLLEFHNYRYVDVGKLNQPVWVAL